MQGCAGIPVTCAPIWSRTVGYGSVALSGGAAVVPAHSFFWLPEEGDPESRIEVLDQATGAIQWTGAVTSAAPGRVTVGEGRVHYSTSTQLRSYPLDATPCTTSCAPSHVADLTGFLQSGGPALANGLVFVGTTSGLQAFDATGSVGCSGTPTVCAPLASVDVGGAWIREIAVARGQVWAMGNDNRLHVFGI